MGSPGFGTAIWPRLTVPRWAAGSAATSPSKNESGIASTRPRPNVGVVRRPTLRTVASAGSRSSGTLQLWLLRPVNWPSVNSWRNDPPSLASGLNTPLSKRPKRRSICSPAPPMAPLVWHWPQACALKIGPRPSLASSNALNASLASANRSASPCKPGNRSPRTAETTAVVSSDRLPQPAATSVVANKS